MSDHQRIRYEHYDVYVREDGSPWELGRGAMGVTYKAFDTSLHTDVALKVISEKCFANPTARKRFEREARAAAKLRHANIASVFHFGTGETESFYAMELVDGETVEHVLRRQGCIETETALEIVIQVSRALSAAAKHNIVHRDLKPANIMLHDDDGELIVKVIDFGLAKQLDNPRDAGVTIQGFVGTPHFASPEQLNERTLDIRSDIYALGATLWHMLAGRPPFTGSVVQIVSQHLSAPLPMEMLRSQPVPVQRLVERMLAKDVADRPRTAAALRHRVRETLDAVRAGTDIPTVQSPEVEDADAETDTESIGESVTPLPASTVGQVPTVERREQPLAAESMRAPTPTAPTGTRKRPWLPIIIAGTVGIAGLAALAGSTWWWMHFLSDSPNIAAEPVATLPPVGKEDPTQLTEKVDNAWREGRNADAISTLAVASHKIPDASKRLERMVRKTANELRGTPSPALRSALIDAAEAGSPTAMLLLANAVVEDHPARAAVWYERAANLGNAQAMTRLGLLSAKGIGQYPPHAERAIPWFEKASEAGDAEGQFALAECYLRGLGSVKKDPKKAIALLQQAAENDFPRALDLLGTVYSRGDVVARDYATSYEYYRRAVELKYAPSMANLGALLMNGHGPSGEPDAAAAIQLFERGANAGNEISMLYLAMALEGGSGLKPDPDKARLWYIAAANAGNARAQAWCKDQGIEGF